MTANIPDGDSERQPFGFLRFDGGRFKGGNGLPLATTAELERYARLVSTVARHLFQEAHPSRKRGFKQLDDSFDLRLSAIEPGSVLPTLTRTRVDYDSLFAVHTDYHEEARRLINEAFDLGGKGRELPPQFPSHAVRDLANIGRGLQGVERMEFADTPSSPVAATVDRSTRKQLQQLAGLDEIDDEVSVVGHIRGLQSDPQRFRFRPVGERKNSKIDAEYTEASTFDLLHTYFGKGKAAPLVEMKLLAVKDRAGKVRRYTDVLSVEPSLPLEWRARLEEVGAVEHGWLYPTTPPPSPEVMASVRDILLAGLDEGVDRPGIFPSADGGVQLEWTGGPRTLEVVVLNNSSVHATWFSDGDDEGDRSFTVHSDPYEIAAYMAEVLRDDK